MQKPWMVAFFTTCAILSAGVLKAESIRLLGGGEITGAILLENEERVVVDLGTQVLNLNRKDIIDISRGAVEESPTGSGFQGRLYEEAGSVAEKPVQELARMVGEAVVEIRSNAGIGSGFVIHPDGYIITNHHVVNGEHRLIVTLFRQQDTNLRKETFRNIRIVSLDPVRDLALLKIDDEPDRKYEHVTIADSDLVRQGQPVFAVGSPLGYDRTVSQGIVSLPNRIMDSSMYIQTTAQINPGNSGGPLFNLRGQVVGVNNRKAMSVGIEGVGFAIPSSILKFFITKRDAFAFDPRNPNSGYRYLEPPGKISSTEKK